MTKSPLGLRLMRGQPCENQAFRPEHAKIHVHIYIMQGIPPTFRIVRDFAVNANFHERYNIAREENILTISTCDRNAGSPREKHILSIRVCLSIPLRE